MRPNIPHAIYLVAIFLMGCSTTPFDDLSMPNSRPYAEPKDGSRARLRISTDGAVRIADNTSCSTWSDPNSGVGPVARGPLLTKENNSKSLGMPGVAPGDLTSTELHVRAGRPLLLHYMKQQGVTYTTVASCDGLYSFIPKLDHDYQAVFRQTADGRLCFRGVVDISSPTVPIPNISSGRRCTN